MQKVFLVLLVLISWNVKTQETRFSSKINFQDGIYLSYRDFASNSPSLRLYELNYKEVRGGLPTQKYFYEFKAGEGTKLSMDTVRIWGICVNGTPYINQSNFFDNSVSRAKVKDYLLVEKHAFIFTKVVLIGHLCHFTALGEVGEPLHDMVPEWNDFLVPGEGLVQQQYLLKVSTGEIEKFTSNNMLRLIKDDEELFLKYSGLSGRKRKKEIFSVFWEYNFNNPFFL